MPEAFAQFCEAQFSLVEISSTSKAQVIVAFSQISSFVAFGFLSG
jgi:hypothetical protein